MEIAIVFVSQISRFYKMDSLKSELSQKDNYSKCLEKALKQQKGTMVLIS